MVRDVIPFQIHCCYWSSLPPIPTTPKGLPSPLPALVDCWIHCLLTLAPLFSSSLPHLHQNTPHMSVGANSKPLTFFALYYWAANSRDVEEMAPSQAHLSSPMPMVWGWRRCVWFGRPQATSHGRGQSRSSPWLTPNMSMMYSKEGVLDRISQI